MTNYEDKLNQLLKSLEILELKQEHFSKDIRRLKAEIQELKVQMDSATADTETPITVIEASISEIKQESTPVIPVSAPAMEQIQETVEQEVSPTNPLVTNRQSNIEKFIGENLINKIGIAITIIGVAIGTKYAIDHELISPLTRIILGYIFGAALLGIAIKLKPKYENYSAVLLSGAMAILYFITFSAYNFYSLIPNIVAFILMVLFTIFTVLASISYNRQVIAHIGLVGAYAIPFLLSDGSGKVVVLFTYMSIINCGILFISFKRDWKSLFYSAFLLSWLIYISWYVFSYTTAKYMVPALVFLLVFFITFYLMVLAFKLLKKEPFKGADTLMLLSNSFIFYGFGYSILNPHPTTEHFLGLFTVLNGLFHFIAGIIIYRSKIGYSNLYYLVVGLVLVFITIAIPVQLNGNWVTLLWAGEAAILFWIGRTKKIPFYESLSYPLMVLAFFSIIHDWMFTYTSYFPEDPHTKIIPVLNIHFLSSLLFVGAFGFITHNRYRKPVTEDKEQNKESFLKQSANVMIPTILIISLYYGIRIEIASYFSQLYRDSGIKLAEHNFRHYNVNFVYYKHIWILNYTMFFVTILGFINLKNFKSKMFGFVCLGLMLFSLILFLTTGLLTLSDLGSNYAERHVNGLDSTGIFSVIIRYITLGFVSLLLLCGYKLIKQEFMQIKNTKFFDLLLHVICVWVLSSELVYWLNMNNADTSFKLGLSILWGAYSLFLIFMGIHKHKKHLRIGAIILFGITLIKVFLYDLSSMNTIAKTIIFVSLGVLLLIISFLYNKYKHIIFDEDKA